ncbi:MAG: CAP domain-containing protein [Pseudomonadota bacterium]
MAATTRTLRNIALVLVAGVVAKAATADDFEPAPKAGGALFPIAFLKAENAGPGDQFGLELAMDGDFAVVGAPAEDGNGSSPADDSANRAGAAYVLRRGADGQWQQEAYLKATVADANDAFGSAVAISGTRVVIGVPGDDSSVSPADNRVPASGAAYVFERAGDGTWAMTAFLKASNRDADDRFGAAVAISGNTILVGAPGEDGDGLSQDDDSRGDSGAAYTFERKGDGQWNQTDYLKADTVGIGDRFGSSAALEGDQALLGAPDEDSRDVPIDNRDFQSGAAYVFVRGRSDSWSQTAILKAENSDPEDNFGASVALSGTTAAIGAPGEDGDGTGPNDDSETAAGAVYVFSTTRDTWVQSAYLKASNAGAGDQFGQTVDVEGDRLIAGAAAEDSLVTSSGAAYAFARSGSSWSETDLLKHVDPGDRDEFGIAVAVSAGRLGVGVFSDDASATGGPFDNTVSTSGAAFVFEPGYSIGGTIVGLEGIRLQISINGEIEIIAAAPAGPFAFDTELPDGATYDVEVAGQPVSPAQTCVVTNGQGTINGSDVNDVLITCTTPTYTVGGSVAGLEGAGLVLQNNGGDDLAINGDGSFTFPTVAGEGAAYAVTILTQPQGPLQACTVGNGAGTIAQADITDVQITCITRSFRIGGTASGLQGGGLVLNNNAIDPLHVNEDGPFQFSLSVPDGDSYDVIVTNQPEDPPQTCTVTNGSGVVAGAEVTDISVNCDPGQVSLGGTVVGLQGSGLVLRNGGGDPLSIGFNGPFVFPSTLSVGDSYAVTVTAQPQLPTQTCTVENGVGTTGSVNVADILVTCVTQAADLVITKTDGVNQAPTGSLLTYTITATNLGPSDVAGARVTDVLPPGLMDATWTCVPDPGAACEPAGVGDIDLLVDLPAGTSIVISLQAVIGTGVSLLRNEANVRVPTGFQEVNLADNRDSDITYSGYVFGGGAGSFEPDSVGPLRDAALNRINSARLAATPAPVPSLPPLVWNADLAAVANAWADGCQFGFNGNRSLDYAARNGGAVAVGETIFASSAALADVDAVSQAILAWRGEASDYDYNSDSCTAGATCGAYTQLVWRDTTAVGCAVASCPGIISGGITGTFVVCNFAPGGNVAGQQPY